MVSDKIENIIEGKRLPSPLPQYRPLSFNGPSPDLQKKLARAAEQRSISGNSDIAASTFRVRLEKHLNDVEKHRSYLSNSVSNEVLQKHRDNSGKLNLELQPGSKYSAYYTALDYEQRARYSAGISEALETAKSIQAASHNSAQVQELLAAQVVTKTESVFVNVEI